jgi:16S rRNA (cytidine1402-2'-O)-methyltransferase
MHSKPGILYLVSTPIGNLGDISIRALETLRGVEVIFAEDTRRTQVLTAHFSIGASLKSLHAHNEVSRVPEVVGLLEAGRDCALVTDAGTPSVSDPGAIVVREVAAAGYTVIAIPGASAVLVALAVSGFSSDQFLFLGFAPRKGRRRREWLEQCVAAGVTVVAFESPHRVGALLKDLVREGIGEASAVVCRELTKLHEEARRGTVATLADYYGESTVRGEITVVIDLTGEPLADTPVVDAETVDEEASRLAATGMSTREVARALRDEFGLTRNEAYDAALRAGRPGADEGMGE